MIIDWHHHWHPGPATRCKMRNKLKYQMVEEPKHYIILDFFLTGSDRSVYIAQYGCHLRRGGWQDRRGSHQWGRDGPTGRTGRGRPTKILFQKGTREKSKKIQVKYLFLLIFFCKIYTIFEKKKTPNGLGFKTHWHRAKAKIAFGVCNFFPLIVFTFL